ncbi:MAG TPA: hypothetical protein VHP11_00435 [Tepidisphaeraceae bacterium]|nr:hypothetical protein [Tepidisphaeraceae bacterium]
MKSRLIWCLVGVNIALAITFIVPRLHEKTALAQIERPADYMMLPGDIGGADRGVVYIVDATNGMMSAVAFENSSGRLEVMPPTDLVRVFQEGAGMGAAPQRRGR